MSSSPIDRAVMYRASTWHHIMETSENPEALRPELESWLCESPQNRQAYRRIEATLKLLDFLRPALNQYLRPTFSPPGGFSRRERVGNAIRRWWRRLLRLHWLQSRLFSKGRKSITAMSDN